MTVSAIVDNATRTVAAYPQARPVIENLKADLVDRDETIAASLISGGVALGARREQVEGLLMDAGLIPTPEPVASPVSDASLDEPTLSADEVEEVFVQHNKQTKSERIAALEQQVKLLSGFARRHGL